jgi:hypothetical protein
VNFIRIGSLKLIPVRRENSLVCSAEKLACKRLSLLAGRLFRGLKGKGPVRVPGLTITNPSNYIIFRAAAESPLLLGGRREGGFGMGVGDLLRKIFSPANAVPPDALRLSGASESALGTSLQGLPSGERGWITLAEAARLFSSEDSQYAFGEMDDAGKLRLAQFSTQHRCSPQFMPTEVRVYFTRNT